jgi:hypothetical protein
MSDVHALLDGTTYPSCPDCAINRPGRHAIVTRVRIPDAVGSFWWCQTCGAELDDADLTTQGQGQAQGQAQGQGPQRQKRG